MLVEQGETAALEIPVMFKCLKQYRVLYSHSRYQPLTIIITEFLCNTAFDGEYLLQETEIKLNISQSFIFWLFSLH